jgi:hypothetical protein
MRYYIEIQAKVHIKGYFILRQAHQLQSVFLKEYGNNLMDMVPAIIPISLNKWPKDDYRKYQTAPADKYQIHQ